jgi:NAD(P)-dependent dehydrogenase (short-subunit alcohol dehydrogenase family)
VGKIVAAGGEAICLNQDVSIEEGWPGVIDATERRFGRLNVMVANAGIGILCKAIEMSLADWRRQTAVNLDGVFLSVKYAVPAMRRAGGGSIIITSSVAGLRGSAGLAGYCATKGGVRLFAKAVAMECAAEGDGIRINTVHPGVIDTPIWTKISSSAGRNAPIDPNEMSKSGGAARPGYRKRCPVPRFGRVQLHDRRRARDRWRHDRRRCTALELTRYEPDAPRRCRPMKINPPPLRAIGLRRHP